MNPYTEVLKGYFKDKGWLVRSDDQDDFDDIVLEVPSFSSVTKYTITITVEDTFARVRLNTGIDIEDTNPQFYQVRTLDSNRLICWDVRHGKFWLLAFNDPGLSIYQIEAVIYDLLEVIESFLAVWHKTPTTVS